MRKTPRVFLVNPANVTVGISFITPRWLFVLASATPSDLLGDPVLIDETIQKFNSNLVEPGDIVGIGITTDNCLAGYRVLREAKLRGATVIFGGIHTTIFPNEPLSMGADAVVTGNGDVMWSKAIEDALAKKLLKRYDGGRLPGELLLPARWDLMKPGEYLFPSLQTIVGCPENCTFCSVWVTEGRKPRQRPIDTIIQEVDALNAKGVSLIALADDNIAPATLGRIARAWEESPVKGREFEKIREQRLAFYDEYAKRVKRIIPAFTQMTSETASDPEYLVALHDKMGVKGALVGVEDVTESGLESIRKSWSRNIVDAIDTIQANGINVLSSVICGLETDTPKTFRAKQEFAKRSKTRFVQYTLYRPYPGTVDFNEMVKDLAGPIALAKHKIRLKNPTYWLDPTHPRVVIDHPTMKEDVILENFEEIWNRSYDPLGIIGRAWDTSWPLMGKLAFFLISLYFRKIFADSGVAADGARKKQLGSSTRLMIKAGGKVLAYSYARNKKMAA